MLNSQAPSEEGDRSNEIKHRYFEFDTAGFNIRAGHFYGLFGRGLVFNSYEDRNVRVDTRLDGLKASYQNGRLSATAFRARRCCASWTSGRSMWNTKPCATCMSQPRA